MAFIYDLTDTWNAGGTTFNAIKMNVTDTASAAASKLVTLQVGGAERFGVRKDGVAFASNGLAVGTTTPAGRLHTQLDTSFSWGAGWSNGVAVFGGATSTSGALAISYNDTDGGTIGAITPGTAWRPVRVFSDNIQLCTNGSTERMRITPAGDIGVNTSVPLSELDVRGVGAPSGVNVTARRSGASYGNSYIQFNAPRSGTADGATVTGRGSIALLGDETTTNATLWLNAQSASLVPETANEATMQGYAAGLRLNSEGSLQFWDNGVQRFGITSAGNVGIGTSSPAVKLDVNGTVAVGYTASGQNLIAYNGDTTNYQRISIGMTGTNAVFNATRSSGTVPNILFQTDSSEKMRIDSSGNLLVGTTSASSSSTANGFVVAGSNGGIVSRRESGANQTHVNFVNGGVSVGTIVTSTTATTYNTSSDYRLKDIDGPIQNSGAYIDALKPVQGSWKADGSRFIGLLAHEVQEVSETQIATGEKDGEEMQAMDYSAPEIIANLIAEIQSLRARVAQLEGN